MPENTEACVFQRLIAYVMAGVTIGCSMFAIVLLVVQGSSSQISTCHSSPGTSIPGQPTFTTLAFLPVTGCVYCVHRIFVQGDPFFMFSYLSLLFGLYLVLFGLDKLVGWYVLGCGHLTSK